ncbi:hypothetical protein [Paraburkholderia bannensis]|uniref:hypothetical protein n=1 Tax=Paraburkholderia bannensis TaxID=765414 RepID=UPI002AB73219|nr:hypothetical protein [Paraburkholderia bannensis]
MEQGTEEWEYEWEFVESGHWGGVKRTNFHMTDREAEVWWAYGKPGTRRLEETQRDRVAHKASLEPYRGLEPWKGGGLPY